MSSLQPVRGTHDILTDDCRLHRHIMSVARSVAERYGFGEISTPVFEFTEVFRRTLGDTSDIVTKEMYTFEDQGGNSLTLRPEGTAGIARAFISNGLSQQIPLKLYYDGSMFRHERPQKGRLREFHQIGVELIGVEGPQGDIETIALGAEILRELGLAGSVVLEINTLGDLESRKAYREALVAYFSGHRDKLSKDSLARLENNPLRILDSKDEGDKALVGQAPVFTDFLNGASKDFFTQVCDGLTLLGVEFVHNPRLVRGLDYYCHTAFEFISTNLGSQGTVLAGGRYDGLIEQMGGPVTPGVGWAAGIERLSMLIDPPASLPRPLAIIPVGDAAQESALKTAHGLRREGFYVHMGYSGNLKKRLTRANKSDAIAAIIMGDDELAKDVATVRNLDTGEQVEVPLAELPAYLSPFR